MNQSSVYRHIEIIVDWDIFVKHMWTWTPLMESCMPFSWPFQEHFDEISDRAIRKNAFVAPLQLLGKTKKKSNFIFIFGQMIEDLRGPGPLSALSKFGGGENSLKKGIFPAHWSSATKLYLRGPDLAHSNPSRLMVYCTGTVLYHELFMLYAA